MDQPVSQQSKSVQPGAPAQTGADHGAAAQIRRPAAAAAGLPSRRAAPKKAALGRARLVTIAVSIVAFVGSLGLISQTSPQTKSSARASNDALPPAQDVAELPEAPVLNLPQSSFTAPSPSAAAPLVLPAPPQRPVLRPFARTRGS